MKITQIRENGDTEALSVVNIDLLIEKMKRETKLRPVSELRQALHFVLPDEPCSLTSKLPRVIPAAAFGRVNGVRQMKTYNGIVELTIGPLAGKTEVEIVKQKAAELPQTMLAFMGASGKSVKIWTCFTRPGRHFAANSGRGRSVSGTCLSPSHQMLSASTSFQYSAKRAETGTVLTS